MSYKHLTTFERSRIELLHQQGFSAHQIGKAIGRHHENANGLLREFFPKKTDLAQVAAEDLEKALLLINSRPRKCLRWKTSYEAFIEELSHLT